MVYDFVAGGAEEELTLRANREAFDRLQLRQRLFVGAAERRSATTVLGSPSSMPLVLGPAGLAQLVHPEAELGAARAAGRAGIPFGLSIGASCSIEEVAAVASGPLWFQAYLWRDRELVKRLLDRARAAGYSALLLTMDVPVVGRRERDIRNGFSAPPRLSPGNLLDIGRRVGWLRDYFRGRPITFRNLVGEADDAAQGDSAAVLSDFVTQALTDASVGWDTVEWLREEWPGKFALKGVMSAADARRGVDAGVDGIVVSNHGGRQMDGLPATLEVLPEIAAEVGGEAEVLIDGGVRRGADIVKALALGARAVLVGRAWWWGLAAGGEQGVAEVIERFRAELDGAQAMLGLPDLGAVGPDAVIGGDGPSAQSRPM